MALPTLSSRPEKTIDSALSRWNAAALPLQYVVANTKWPTNTEDDIDTITSVSDDNGYAKIFTITSEIYKAKEYINVLGTTNYNGVQLIRTVAGSGLITIDAPFVADETGTLQRYFQNYTTLVRVYAGLPPTHEFAYFKEIELIGTIEQRPNTDSISYVDIRKYILSNLSTFNDVDQSSFPNDLNLWTGFYIEWAERYDQVLSGEVFNFTSVYQTDLANLCFASHSALQFRNENGGNMENYLITNAESRVSPTKFMTDFERPVLFLDQYFDISIISPTDNFLQIKEYDINRTLLKTTSISVSDNGDGLYRLRLDDIITYEDDTDHITVQLISPDSFTFQVTTTNTGASGNDQFTLPLLSTGTYDFEVVWGDDEIETITAYDQAETQHTYAAAGTYTVKIFGTVQGWSFTSTTNDADPQKIIEISRWGGLQPTGSNVFNGCINLDVTAPDALSLTETTTLEGFYKSCSSLTSTANYTQWNTSGITDMSEMFNGCSLFNGDITAWDTSSVTSLLNTFFGCTIFNQNVNTWDVSSVTNLGQTFLLSSAFNQDISSWDVSSVTSMSGTFNFATSFNQDISSWTVSAVTNFRNAFANSAFNQDIDGWDTSAATSMQTMFQGASSFNQALNSWDVSNVTTMSQMFFQSAMNGNIGSWDVSAVTNMLQIFGNSPFNQPLNSWTVTAVTNFQGAFESNTAFNSNITSWVTSAATDMSNMFRGATAFNQDISGWTVTAVTNFFRMFGGATVFDQDISGWGTGAATDMSSMFSTAIAFDRDIGAWDVTNVTDMSSMFSGVVLATANYDAILVGWEAQAVQNNVVFDGGSSTYTSAGAGGTARAALIADHTWTITDGGGV